MVTLPFRPKRECVVTHNDRNGRSVCGPHPKMEKLVRVDFGPHGVSTSITTQLGETCVATFVCPNIYQLKITILETLGHYN
jgi:hypothetical protein